DDAKKIAQLIAEIDAARRRIEDRAREIAGQIALHAAKLAAALYGIGKTEADKPVKEWGNAFIVMIAAGTTPDLQTKPFLQEFNEILEKTTQIARLGRDIVALGGIGSVIKSVSDAAGGVGLHSVEALLTAGGERVRAVATRLRAGGGSEAIAAARAA